ncbi:MAG: endopeptidase La [Bacteroidales bacterium]|jgi:ATP-dependent Lon protease|nr:endopeptidase La [Bacteroidales bacterium]MED9962428.1 endopeptidase La [Bacteroidales bacterium]MEE0267223.1 endopeptidase La [Bacteroidales bacterium]MEE0882800.1 endopeptidase La [Bacteroidales bacterium]MEE1220827.1 endopeptidase La [Bacteroidales bacterium]
MLNKDLAELTELMSGGDAEIIPIMTEENIKDLSVSDMPELLPILPLRGNVFFPGVITPITAGREKSIKLIKTAYKNRQIIGIVAQKSISVEDPDNSDLYKVGTLAKVVKTLNMPDGSTMVILQGLDRFCLEELTQTEPYWMGKVKEYPDGAKDLPENYMALAEAVKDMYLRVLKMVPNIPADPSFAIQNIENPYFLLNYVAAHLDIAIKEKQKLLETNDFTKRANKVLSILSKELELQKLKLEIQKKVSTDMDKQQRDYLLTQQLKTIQEELGGSPSDLEIAELRKKASTKKWSKDVSEVFEKEIRKLSNMHVSSPDYSIQLNYLNFMIDLPWGEFSNDNFDLDKAQKILDADHYGLEKVKQRILEYLAVLKLKGNMKSPVLCLVGPPGVGKTSLGKSIARATGRKYVRVALGGLSDESEIRGHRRTYIGAMPGRILKSISKAKTSNPVFVLDEIDKVQGMSAHGDPASAMLEVLDPEQNTAFHDNYLDIDYDLSNVMFIATANSLSNVHPALIDRMEVIDVSGYIEEEKQMIATKHLLPKQLAEHGLKKKDISISNETLSAIINQYTRESGVRKLDKVIAKIVRHRAVQIVKEEEYTKAIKPADLQEILGLPTAQHDVHLEEDMIGVVTGLAWTSVGGEILFIEASKGKGKGNINLTGNLGNVMKESATLAYEYIKSNAVELGLNEEDFENTDIYLHVPEGATPKDGPSAGVTMFTAIYSLFSKRKVNSNFAMTGEITLRGLVLPVGGIKEKILAAKRAKITDIILSESNRKDVEDINSQYLEGLTFHYVKTMCQIPDLVLEK